ncbi:MAG: FMN-binding protein [Candidatus Eisenbacteria sp.]|nr:FMN-binding protein [Candidatus Eisenbacteria bacterium]
MREFFKRSWLVLVCAFAFGLLLAVTYASWQPRIERNRILRLQRGIRSILTDADSIATDTLTIERGGAEMPAVVYTGLDEQNQPVGYVFAAKGTGFQDRIELLVGLGPQLARYRGIAVLFAAETPGFGDAIRDSVIFKCQFIGTPADSPLNVVKGPDKDRPKTDDYEIVSITGATITSEAVTRIVNRRNQEMREALREHTGQPRSTEQPSRQAAEGEGT